MKTKITLLALAFALLLPSAAHGQFRAVSVRAGATNPTTCQPSGTNIFLNTTADLLYICTATNTWTSLAAGGGSGDLTAAGAGWPVTGNVGFTGALMLPNSITPPAADCDADAEKGRIYIDTNATSGQQVYVCEGLAVGWKLQGDGGGGGSLPVVDTTSLVEGSGDATKEVRIEADGITTGTIRVWTAPNADTTLPIFSQIATFAGMTAARTYTLPDVNSSLAPLASPTFTGTVTIPTPFTLGAVSVLPTGTELNFVDGVTSALQTQLDLKAPLAAPTFSGSVDLGTLTLIPRGAAPTGTDCDAAGEYGRLFYDTDAASGQRLYACEAGGWILQGDGGGGGANTALSNLAAVAINTSLVSDTANTDDLGSLAIPWKSLFIGDNTKSVELTRPSAASARYFLFDAIGAAAGDAFRIHNFAHPTGSSAIPEGYNVFIGTAAGNLTTGSTATATTNASNNVGIGRSVLAAVTTGSGNVAIGQAAGDALTTGTSNVLLGINAGGAVTGSIGTVAIGENAGLLVTSGHNGVYIGRDAGKGNTGGPIVAIGYQAGRGTANNGVFVGEGAGGGSASGIQNTVVGENAMGGLTSGTVNSAFGVSALAGVSTTSSNVGVGNESGRYLADGSTANATPANSVYLGTKTKSSAAGQSNETVIGYDAIGKGSNTAVIGDDNVTQVWISEDAGAQVVSATLGRVDAAATVGASQAGLPVEVKASNAVASTDTAGAAAGGSVTITGGAAARLTSGNADGGDLIFTGGAGIGTGVLGTFRPSANISMNIGETSFRWSTAYIDNLKVLGGSGGFSSGTGNLALLGTIGDKVFTVTNTSSLTYSSTSQVGWAANTTEVNAVSDIALMRHAAGVLKVTNGTSTTIAGFLGGGANVASASAITPTGAVFHVTGTTNIDSVTLTNVVPGLTFTMIFDGILTVGDASNLKLTAAMVTTADDTLTLTCDATNCYEISRSVN